MPPKFESLIISVIHRPNRSDFITYTWYVLRAFHRNYVSCATMLWNAQSALCQLDNKKTIPCQWHQDWHFLASKILQFQRNIFLLWRAMMPLMAMQHTFARAPAGTLGMNNDNLGLWSVVDHPTLHVILWPSRWPALHLQKPLAQQLPRDRGLVSATAISFLRTPYDPLQSPHLLCCALHHYDGLLPARLRCSQRGTRTPSSILLVAKLSILSNPHQVATATISFFYLEEFPVKSEISIPQVNILHTKKFGFHATRGALLAWTASRTGVDEVIDRRTPDCGSSAVI